MTMRANDAPRKLYTRGGIPLVCYAGLYFGPGAKLTSQVDPTKEIRVKVVKPAGGRKRVEITQGKVHETWHEHHVTVHHRAA